MYLKQVNIDNRYGLKESTLKFWLAVSSPSSCNKTLPILLKLHFIIAHSIY